MKATLVDTTIVKTENTAIVGAGICDSARSCSAPKDTRSQFTSVIYHFRRVQKKHFSIGNAAVLHNSGTSRISGRYVQFTANSLSGSCRAVLEI